MSPLTPARAIAWAALFEAHPRRLPHWDQWVRELREWASEQTETPSQDTENALPTGTLRGVNEAVPESALTLAEDLTASPQLSNQEA